MAARKHKLDLPTAGLLTIPETALYLNQSESWVRRQVDERTIPYVKMRKYVMFRKSDLDAYIEANLVMPSGDDVAIDWS